MQPIAEQDMLLAAHAVGSRRRLVTNNTLHFSRLAEHCALKTGWIGGGTLYTSPFNVNITGVRRVNNWLDVETLFLSMPADLLNGVTAIKRISVSCS